MRILLRNGPTGGSLADVKVKNTVLACTDWVAADTYATSRVFGMPVSNVPYIKAAANMHLGTMNLASVDRPERLRGRVAGAKPDPGARPEAGADAGARRSTGGWKAARWARRAVQIAFLAFFVYLLFAALQRRAAFPYADFFFRLDPLAAFAPMVAARHWIGHLAPALVTVALAVVVGRVWCGWICPHGDAAGLVPLPLGAPAEQAGARRASASSSTSCWWPSPSWRRSRA